MYWQWRPSIPVHIRPDNSAALRCPIHHHALRHFTPILPKGSVNVPRLCRNTKIHHDIIWGQCLWDTPFIPRCGFYKKICNRTQCNIQKFSNMEFKPQTTVIPQQVRHHVSVMTDPDAVRWSFCTLRLMMTQQLLWLCTQFAKADMVPNDVNYKSIGSSEQCFQYGHIPFRLFKLVFFQTNDSQEASLSEEHKYFNIVYICLQASIERREK
jgi:hypothetical protein